MWNLLSRTKETKDCKSLRDLLEGVSEISALPAPQQQHLAACAECQAAADEVFAARAILRDLPRRAELPGPWFAPRVMAAIAVRESELRQSLDAWAAVPRFAARLTWVSALALLLASSWLYQSPKSAQTSASQSAIESLFDSPQPTPPDDVLPPATERAQ